MCNGVQTLLIRHVWINITLMLPVSPSVHLSSLLLLDSVISEMFLASFSPTSLLPLLGEPLMVHLANWNMHLYQEFRIFYTAVALESKATMVVQQFKKVKEQQVLKKRNPEEEQFSVCILRFFDKNSLLWVNVRPPVTTIVINAIIQGRLRAERAMAANWGGCCWKLASAHNLSSVITKSFTSILKIRLLNFSTLISIFLTSLVWQKLKRIISEMSALNCFPLFCDVKPPALSSLPTTAGCQHLSLVTPWLNPAPTTSFQSLPSIPGQRSAK